MLDKSMIIASLVDVLALTQDDQFEEAFVRMGAVNVTSLVNYYTNNISNDMDNDDKTIIEMLIRIFQAFYNNSKILSPIPDQLYDELYEVHRDVNGTEIVGAPVVGGVKVNHKYPDLRGTLDKIHFLLNRDKKKLTEKRKSLEQWINSTANRLGRPFRDGETDGFAFPKWDGISAIFECNAEGLAETVLSRGDTDINEAKDFTRMFKGTTNMSYLVPSGVGEFGVKTEIVMTRDNYEKFQLEFGEFSSPRSAVSSIFNSNDLDKKYLPYLTVIPLQIQLYSTKEIFIPQAAYEDYPFYRIDLTDVEMIRECISKLQLEVEEGLGIDIDGIVIRLINKHVQGLLGRDDKINKYEVAYKFPAVEKRTILKDVVFSVGILGGVTPVAKVETVKMKGNNISSISLGSLDRFDTLDLHEGDEVILKYDVIPYLDKDNTCKPGNGALFIRPTHCPVCKTELQSDPIVRCVNSNCDSRMIGKIMKYVNELRIMDISIGKITTLFKAGFLTTIADLYHIKDNKRKIAQIPGFGEKSVQKIIDGIDARRKVYDYMMLGAIGIPGIAQKTFKKILSVYTLKELLSVCRDGKVSKLTTLKGVEKNTAVRIIKGVQANEELIGKLLIELDVSRDDRKYTIKVLFTKVRPSEEFADHLDAMDVMILDNYSKEVDIVVIPKAGTTSKKVEDAIKDGKNVVTLEDAYEIFKFNK